MGEIVEVSDNDKSRLRYVAAVSHTLKAIIQFERRINPVVTKCIQFIPPCPACGTRMTEEHAKFVDPEPIMESLLVAAERKISERMRPVLRAMYGHRVTCEKYPDFEKRLPPEPTDAV